ncbi:MAG: SDR family oxidoreductase [Alphaproteobacteria bacterium]|nr:SDR family oxidoreductase [Alphaproteobacteria bacterium]
MLTADLKGKAALVTGGISGIGLAAGTMFATQGARVALNHLPDDSRAPAVLADLRRRGLDVIGAPGDVGKPGEAEAMVGKAVADLGRLDYLLNNAGTPGTTEPIVFENLDAMSEEFWARLLAVNLLGPFRCAHAAAPHLKRARGAIVNTASIAGLGSKGSSIAYGATKGGLVNLTTNLARALAPEVRVNAVAPGLVDSPWTAGWPKAWRDQAIEAALLKRTCAPEDIAEVMLFLCAGARMVTGRTIVVDGGRYL